MPGSLLAQELIEDKGTFSLIVPEYLSQMEAKVIAIQQAKRALIEKHFGSSINEINTLISKSALTDGSEDFVQEFNSYLSENIRGIWVKDINPPIVTKKIIEGQLALEVSVHGLVREKKTNKSQLEATLRNCPRIQCKTNEFKSGDRIYLSLKSAQKGNIAVFWEVIEDNTVYRLFPNEASISSFKIEADSIYNLFNESISEDDQKIEITLPDSRSHELNKLIVLFSDRTDALKPILDKGNQTSSRLETPDSKESSDFYNWLSSIEKDVQISSQYVFITK